jgi:hypothetical protein
MSLASGGKKKRLKVSTILINPNQQNILAFIQFHAILLAGSSAKRTCSQDERGGDGDGTIPGGGAAAAAKGGFDMTRLQMAPPWVCRVRCSGLPLSVECR